MRPRALDSGSSLAVLFQGRRRVVAAAEVSARDRARYEELRDNRILDLDRGIYRASHIALCSRYQLPAPPIRALTGDWKAQHSAAKQPGRITATAPDFL
jgi:hypothetical protein